MAETTDRTARRNLLAEFGGRGHDVVLPGADSQSSDISPSWRAPVVFASPHSGAVYPDSLRRASGLSLRELRRNEDAFVDGLFACAPELGAPLIRARFPRCYVDVNRAVDDLPPEWRREADGLATAQTASDTETGAYRARLGLGVVPLVISDTLAIYRHPPSVDEVHTRIDALYRPYHDTLATLLRRTRETFGQALLVDCHSMPGFAASPRTSGLRKGRTRGSSATRRADIVLGDAHGRAAEPAHTALIQEAFERRGYRVVRNHPYAGGHTTLHYGRPQDGVSVVQIEINRDLYLNPATLKPKAGYQDLARDIRSVVAEIIDGLAPEMAVAAE